LEQKTDCAEHEPRDPALAPEEPPEQAESETLVLRRLAGIEGLEGDADVEEDGRYERRCEADREHSGSRKAGKRGAGVGLSGGSSGSRRRTRARRRGLLGG